tara:strand:+ start:812 stop:1099 length:288 start_codon:yes stop_codon:yes gene_type:complete
MNELINDLINKIDGFQGNINALTTAHNMGVELAKKDHNEIVVLRDEIDDLEAKNYLLRHELDAIYKVLNMDACDIKALQDKVFNGHTREQKKGSK